MLSSLLNCCALLLDYVLGFWAHVMLLVVPTACNVMWLLPNVELQPLGLNTTV